MFKLWVVHENKVKIVASLFHKCTTDWEIITRCLMLIRHGITAWHNLRLQTELLNVALIQVNGKRSVDCSAKYTDLCWFVNASSKEDQHCSTRSNISGTPCWYLFSLTDVPVTSFYKMQNISVLVHPPLLPLHFKNSGWLQLHLLFSTPSPRYKLMLSSHSQRLTTEFSKLEWYLSVSSLEPHGCIKYLLIQNPFLSRLN